MAATTLPLTRTAWLEAPAVQFWLLQLAGWSGWAVAGSIGWIYWQPETPYVQVYTLCAIFGVAISTLLRQLYRRIWAWPIDRRAVAALLASYVSGAIWQLAKNLIVHSYLPDNDFAKMGWLGYFEGVTGSFYIMVTWSGLYFGIKWYQMLQAESAKVLRITAMAHQAQLKMLRYQLNPHFLFNTLNAISTLTLDHDTQRANDMITKLSRFLRYSLDSDPMQKVTVEQELQALSLYLDIERVRFGERLKLELDVSERAKHGYIPSLLLQPLVENAVKYAVARSERGGVIRIRADVKGPTLTIEVADDGPGMHAPKTSDAPDRLGVGLANTRDRLAELYGDRHELTTINVAPHGLMVAIQLPFETNP